jgi:hypothetical protein
MIENRRSIVRKAVVLLSSAAVVAGGIFVGAAPASATVAAVTVTKLSVTKGSDVGGTTVLITGKGFTTWTVVSADVVFNGTAVAAGTVPIVLSDTQMAVVAPAKGAGTLTGNVVVTDSVGGGVASVASTANAWTYITPLALTAITVGTKLNPLGGTVLPVVTAGLGLNKMAFDALKVTATVGSATAKVTWISATAATILVPVGTPSVTKTKICLLSNGVFDATTSCDILGAAYATVISKLSVTSGVATGNSSLTAMTITGKGFTGATQVAFGAVNAASFVIVSDTKITCPIPAGAASPVGGVVQVIVTPLAAAYGTTATSAYSYTDV